MKTFLFQVPAQRNIATHLTGYFALKCYSDMMILNNLFWSSSPFKYKLAYKNVFTLEKMTAFWLAKNLLILFNYLSKENQSFIETDFHK